MVLTVSFVLFPATNSFLSPSPTDWRFSETRFGSQNLCRLDISNGCQNHTTSPYASAPFVCARVHRAPNASASTASHPAFVTTRDPPLVSGVRRGKLIEVICPTAKAEYFCQGGLDDPNQIEIAGINRFARKGRGRWNPDQRSGISKVNRVSSGVEVTVSLPS